MRPWRRGRAALAWAAALAGVCGASPCGAQGASVEAGTDTIRVGDAVRVVVRVPIGPGERILWPDTLPLAGVDAENASSVRERIDTLSDGGLEAAAVYTVTPWRTGEIALPAVAVGRIAGDEAVTTRFVSLPTLPVASVLPDSTGLEPKPAKSVVGPSWAWTSILLAVLAVAALAAALFWWLRRRRPERGIEIAVIDPRERALARLDAALASGLLEHGSMKPFYTRVSHAVRGYLADLDREWGDDLTSTEVLVRVRVLAGTGEAAAVARLLHPADQVKFARRRPDPATAKAEWQQARDWVVGFSWPPPAPPAVEAA